MTFSYFDVPEKQQRFMNTTFYRFIVEPLYHKYPGMPISINVDIADVSFIPLFIFYSIQHIQYIAFSKFVIMVSHLKF